MEVGEGGGRWMHFHNNIHVNRFAFFANLWPSSIKNNSSSLDQAEIFIFKNQYFFVKLILYNKGTIFYIDIIFN
jgi:hypothetical protein